LVPKRGFSRGGSGRVRFQLKRGRALSAGERPHLQALLLQLLPPHEDATPLRSLAEGTDLRVGWPTSDCVRLTIAWQSDPVHTVERPHATLCATSADGVQQTVSIVPCYRPDGCTIHSLVAIGLRWFSHSALFTVDSALWTGYNGADSSELRAPALRRRDILKATGLSSSGVDYYAQQGIVKRRRGAGQRDWEYADDTSERIQLARQLTSLGFSTSDIASLLDSVALSEVTMRLASLPADRFRAWFFEVLGR
jgi:hypothetical protein